MASGFVRTIDRIGDLQKKNTNCQSRGSKAIEQTAHRMRNYRSAHKTYKFPLEAGANRIK